MTLIHRDALTWIRTSLVPLFRPQAWNRQSLSWSLSQLSGTFSPLSPRHRSSQSLSLPQKYCKMLPKIRHVFTVPVKCQCVFTLEFCVGGLYRVTLKRWDFNDDLNPVKWDFNDDLNPVKWDFNDYLNPIKWDFNDDLNPINRGFNDDLKPIKRDFNDDLIPIKWAFNDYLKLIKWAFNDDLKPIKWDFNDDLKSWNSRGFKRLWF